MKKIVQKHYFFDKKDRMFIIKIKKEALFMKESIKQEMQRRVLQQDLVGENA